MRSIALGFALFIVVTNCPRGTASNTPAPSSTDVKKFLDEANERSLKLGTESNQASWVSENFITDDTSSLNASANQRAADAGVRYAKEAAKFDHVDVDSVSRRELNLLRVSLTMATPSNPKEGEELTRIAADMDGEYGKGKWCEDPKKPDSCLDINQITNTMRDSQDEKKLRQVWEGWHTISLPMRKDYTRFVDLSNKGAKELGFSDSGAMWRSKYDMSPEDFTKELDRLWTQVRPLYVKLHAYVRMKLREKYGDVVPANGPLP